MINKEFQQASLSDLTYGIDRYRWSKYKNCKVAITDRTLTKIASNLEMNKSQLLALHTSPLKYTAHGVNGTTFALERSRFKSELEACHAIANNIPAKPKNDLFHALGVFCFTTKAELVGDKQKAWCCRVVSHQQPKLVTWRNYFLGFTDLKDYVWEALEPEQKDVLTVPALSPARGLSPTAAVEALPPVSENDISW